MKCKNKEHTRDTAYSTTIRYLSPSLDKRAHSGLLNLLCLRCLLLLFGEWFLFLFRLFSGWRRMRRQFFTFPQMGSLCLWCLQFCPLARNDAWISLRHASALETSSLIFGSVPLAFALLIIFLAVHCASVCISLWLSCGFLCFALGSPRLLRPQCCLGLALVVLISSCIRRFPVLSDFHCSPVHLVVLLSSVYVSCLIV